MNVLMVAPEFPPGVGGMQAHAGETAARLAARGHDVLVLTATGNAPAGAAIPCEVRAVLDRNPRAAAEHIRAAARRHQARALLLMNAGFAPMVTSLAGATIPVVVRTAGNDAYGAWYGPRLPLRFLLWRLPHRRPGSLGSRLRRIDQDRRVAAVLSALSRCDRVLCNSRYVLARLRDLGVSPDRLRTLVGGVDTDLFRPDGAGGPGTRNDRDGLVLGIAGHLLPVKGIAVALRMLTLLEGAARGVRLRIAGDGPEASHLRDEARALGIDGRVEFVGDLGAAEMARFYRGLDLYLQPSVEVHHPASGIVQVETMGRALCEASACGLPVVASRTGGISDVVEDGVTGRLVPPGDPVALAGVVGALLASPADRRLLGEAGRRHAVERFSWASVILETERHLLEAGSRGA